MHRFVKLERRQVHSVALDPSGNIFVVGSFTETLSIGATSAGLGLAVDSKGNAVIAGALSGTVDVGAGALSSTGGLDVLLAKFLD